MRKIVGVLFVAILLSCCSGEYNKSFRHVYNQAKKINSFGWSTMELIRMSSDYDYDYKMVFEINDETEIKTALDSIRIYFDALKEIDENDKSFRDVSELYRKSIVVVQGYLERDIAKLDTASFDLDTYIGDFREKYQDRLK